MINTTKRFVDGIKRITNTAAVMAGVVAASLMAAMPASAQAPDEITIGFANDVIAISNLRAADELGLYAKHNIRPKFIYFESASIATTALIAGSIQIAVGGPSELVAAQARGQKIVSIGVLYGGVANTLILHKAVVDKLGVSPNAPVPERIKALEGLNISAVSPTAAAGVAIRGQAKALGVNPKYSYMSLDALMSALETRATDGYVAAFPVWALPVLKGTAVPWLTGPKGEFPPEFAPGVSSVAMVKRDYAETHADLMRRMGLVMTEFAKAVEDDLPKVRDVVGKLYPKLDPKVVDFFFANEINAWKAKPLDTKGWAHEIEFMRSAGAISPDLLEKLDPATMPFP